MTMVNQSTEKLKAKNNNKTTMLKQLKIKNIYCMWQLNIKTPEKSKPEQTQQSRVSYYVKSWAIKTGFKQFLKLDRKDA